MKFYNLYKPSWKENIFITCEWQKEIFLLKFRNNFSNIQADNKLFPDSTTWKGVDKEIFKTIFE